MSTSNAAAIRRRTNIQQTPNTQSSTNQTSSNPTQPNDGNAGMTLPQVIALIDKRLIILEKFMKDSKDSTENTETTETTSAPVNQDNSISRDIFNTIITEYNNRFEILAVEINNIKDTLLKLQTYTMEVNKMLLEERTNDVEPEGTINITNPFSDENIEESQESVKVDN